MPIKKSKIIILVILLLFSILLFWTSLENVFNYNIATNKVTITDITSTYHFNEYEEYYTYGIDYVDRQGNTGHISDGVDIDAVNIGDNITIYASMSSVEFNKYLNDYNTYTGDWYLSEISAVNSDKSMAYFSFFFVLFFLTDVLYKIRYRSGKC